MAPPSRPKGRRSTTRAGTTEPSGAVVPEPRIRRRAGADREAGEDAAEPAGTDETGETGVPPAEVVHLIPAEHLDLVDTTGMSMPVGVGDSASAVRLPGDTVLTRPDDSDIPSDEELDRRDAAKGTRRKRTGPKPPGTARRDPNAPAESAPPPTDPADPSPTDPADPS